MGLPVLVALVSNGVTLGAALTATYGVVGGVLIRVAASALISAAGSAIFRPQTPTGLQQDVRRRISQQTELPFKRFVYGRAFAAGTPLPGVARGGYYYVAYLLSSRPSEGNFEVYLDNRVVQVTGDPYNFSGPGAKGTNGLFNGHVEYWISRGDETGPPDKFVNEAGFDAGNPTLNALGYKATDGGQGCTILWAKLRRGGDENLQTRWPGYPFVNASVSGDWAKVWDPRDSNQTATDASTHTFSRNQALIGLDLAMRNPFRPYQQSAVEVGQWSTAADVADEAVPLRSGGNEPRYVAGGTVLFDGSELEQLMQPVMEAGASSLVRSGGKLGIVTGVAKNRAVTIEDMVGLPSVSAIAPAEAQFDEVNVTYAPLDRDGEPANLRPWRIPGVVGSGLPRVLSLDLGMVPSATQAMRIRKIQGLKTTYMRTLEGIAFPETFAALSGSWVSVALGYTKLDGDFEITSMTPVGTLVDGQEGIAFQLPITLRETSDAIYAWEPQVDEEDVDQYQFVYDEEGVQPGGPILIETGNTVNLVSDGAVVPRIRFSFAPSPSSNISGYEVQSTEQGETYSAATSIAADAVDGMGKVFGFLVGLAGQPYDFRIRAVSAAGISEYVEFTGATPVVDIDLGPPVFNAVTGGDGQIDIDVSAPNDEDVIAIEVVQSDTDDAAAGTLFFESAAVKNQRFQFALTGLGPSQTKYIFARVRGNFASVGAYAGSGPVTTNA